MTARDLAGLLALVPIGVAMAAAGAASGAPAQPPPSGSAIASASSAAAPSARRVKPRPRDQVSLEAISAALADHKASNFGQADRKLARTVDRCGTNGCSAPVKARALMALGVVRSDGLRNEPDARAAFEQALQLDDQAELPAQAGSDAQRVFREVKERLFPPPPPEPTAPAASSAPPVPVEVPVAPLQTLGDAAWKDGVGLVRPGEAPPPVAKDKSWGRPITLAKVPSLRFDEFEFQLQAGKIRYNPINDGKTDASGATDLSGILLELRLRPEWRSAASPIAAWFEIHLGMMPRASGPIQLPNTVPMKPIDAHLTHLEFGGRFGLDVVPITFVGFGPFIGYRGDVFLVSLDDGDSLRKTGSNTGYSAIDHGMDYGGHLRLRTQDHTDEPALLYADASMFRRRGSVLTGTYQRLELGVRPGALTVLGLWYQRRSSASGYVSVVEVKDPADVLGKTMAVESAFGIGFGAAFSTFAPETAATPAGSSVPSSGGRK